MVNKQDQQNTAANLYFIVKFLGVSNRLINCVLVLLPVRQLAECVGKSLSNTKLPLQKKHIKMRWEE